MHRTGWEPKWFGITLQEFSDTWEPLRWDDDGEMVVNEEEQETTVYPIGTWGHRIPELDHESMGTICLEMHDSEMLVTPTMYMTATDIRKLKGIHRYRTLGLCWVPKDTADTIAWDVERPEG